MALISARTPEAAHYHIVSGLHVSLRLLEEFGRSLHWTISDDIKEIGDKTLSLAGRPKSKPIEHHEYKDMAHRARMVCSNAWGAMLQDTSLDVIAPIVNTLEQLGETIDKHGQAAFDEDGRVRIPDVGARLVSMREEMAGLDPTHMTPVQKLNHDRDLRSVGAAMDAIDNLEELRKGGPKEIKVASLNVEFVNEASLRSWLLSMTVQGGLPESPKVLHDALDYVQKYRHVDATIKDRLSEAWGTDVPGLDEQGLETAVRALLGSAISTRMDSFEYSAVEVVKSIVDSTYEESASREKRQTQASKSTELMSQSASAQEIRELEPLLIDLDRSLTSLESGLGHGVARKTVNDIQTLIERVTAKAEVLKDLGLEEGEEPTPR
ncbi:hypothetical protein [Marinobacter salarius]|uniref:Uncharacterized protein n=1 Tax=Marinobacter salarius TaxID=1420917 RepID=A0A1W6KFZ4_9GAMM|nr:hypothetical protein [Marinobacter salarius]ARM86323.1 hypothetical protein MARSALSMR5_04306 [Marinobacter salarius]